MAEAEKKFEKAEKRWKAKIEYLKAKKVQIRNQNRNLEETIHLMKEEHEKAQTSLQDLVLKFGDQCSSNGSLADQLTQLTSRLHELERELEEERHRAFVREEDLKDAQAESSENIAKVTLLQREIASKDAQLSDLRIAKKTLDLAHQTAISDLEKLTKQLSEKTIKVDRYVTDLMSLTRKNAENERQIAKLHSENERLRSELRVALSCQTLASKPSLPEAKPSNQQLNTTLPAKRIQKIFD